ncbi:MAG: imelysin family protein [Taibaiella sp.]|nr:imelysin family protein [Taibaiella sp.]
MKKWYLTAGILMMVLTTLSISCKKNNDSPSDNGMDRKPMLENYASNYIVPAYADMVQQLSTLKTSVEVFTAHPDGTTQAAAQAAWRSAYITWQKVDLLEFGPAYDKSLRTYMNIYPVTVSKVEGNVSSGSYDLETFGSKDAQGFPALDYLLNGTTLDKYTTDPQAANRKQYLLAVIEKMLQKTTEVRNEWNDYKNTFISNTGTDAGSSLSEMVNNYVLYYERYFRSGKIGLPVGAMSGVAKVDLTEAYYTQGLTKELALTAMTSVINFYSGKSYDGASTGESMKSYLAAIGTKDDNGTLMADLITQEMNEALAGIQNMNGSLQDNIQNNRTAVLNTYEQIQEVVPLLKVDMVSAFSISITYTDNDGD